MDKERIMDAMNYLDPALIEEADRNASHARRRRISPVLAAACLCLVLAGTAAAMSLSGVQVLEFFRNIRLEGLEGWAGTGFGYTVEGGIRRIPLEALSEEARGLAAEGDENGFAYASFSTWAEAEAFLGIELMDNRALEGAEPPDGWDGGDNCSVTAKADGGALTYITVDAAYFLDGGEDAEPPVSVLVTAWIYTDQSCGSEEELKARVRKIWRGDGAFTQETYTAPGGLEAVIVQCEDCAAWFSLEGALFEVSIPSAPAEADRALAALKTVLDSFQ